MTFITPKFLEYSGKIIRLVEMDSQETVDRGIYFLIKQNRGSMKRPAYRIRKSAEPNDITWWLRDCIKSEI